MGEDRSYGKGVLDGGDDPQGPATAGTGEDIEIEHGITFGVVIMEGLTNLGALPRRRVEFAAPFYKIAGTEGAPARFFATV